MSFLLLTQCRFAVTLATVNVALEKYFEKFYLVGSDHTAHSGNNHHLLDRYQGPVRPGLVGIPNP